MRIFLTSLIATSLVAFAPTLAHSETVLSANTQQALKLTIYQNGLAFVRDQRALSLNKGDQDFVFEGVSPQLIPDSLLIAGSGFAVKERNFAFDVMTPALLLEKSLGKKVTFKRFNSVTGKDDVFQARVLSTQGGVIVERDGKIEVAQPGHLVLDKLPKGLRPQPALGAVLNSSKKQETELALAYLSGGLSWKTSYSLELNKTGTQVGLRAWANLTNTSGIDFQKADLALAAGQINRQSRPLAAPVMAKTMMRAVAADAVMEAAPPAPQSVGGLHIYDLSGKLDLPNKATKQVALLPAQSFKSKRVLVQRFGPLYRSMPAQSSQALHPQIEVTFTNDSGQPLPSGLARLYRQDTAGVLQFVGEDQIKSTPNKNKVRLHPGQSFDVTLTRNQTDFKKTGKNEYEAAYQVVIKNAKKTKETVRIEQSFPGEWSLEKASHKPMKKMGQQAVWSIEVKPQSETVLTFEVDVKIR